LEKRISTLDQIEAQLKNMGSLPKIDVKAAEGGKIDTSAIFAHIEKL